METPQAHPRVIQGVRRRDLLKTGLAAGLMLSASPLHRPLARLEHLPAVLELRFLVYVGVDQVLDRAIDRSRVLIHAVLDMKNPFIHMTWFAFLDSSQNSL